MDTPIIWRTPGLVRSNSAATMSADTPSRRNTGTAHAHMRRMSSPAARHGERDRSIVPKCSLVEMREPRMPPSAPRILEERGDEDEQCREREERLDALLDRDPGDHVDRAGEDENR